MVFTRFMAIYGHKFKSAFETETEMRIAKREWALSLGGYSEAELVAAVNCAKETLAWAPSISEFLHILQDLNQAFGLPDVRQAYREACMHAATPSRHSWSHPLVYAAGRATGWFELRSESEQHSFPLFNYHFEILSRRVRRGEDIELSVPAALENKQSVTSAFAIAQWTQHNGLSDELGSSLLYYTTKPEGTKARENFRNKSIARAKALGLDLDFPV